MLVVGIDEVIQSRIVIDDGSKMRDRVHRDLAVKMMGSSLMSEVEQIMSSVNFMKLCASCTVHTVGSGRA